MELIPFLYAFLLILLCVFVVLNVWDFFLTKAILAAGGIEQNPVMRFILDRFHWRGMIIFKSVVIVSVCYQALSLTMGLYTLFCIDMIYAAVLVSMYFEKRRLEKFRKRNNRQVSI